MDIQSTLNKLETDRINNIGIINFIKNNHVLSIDTVGNCIVVRGISDRKWVYINCPDNYNEYNFNDYLNRDDLCFAAIDEGMVPVITEGKEIVWDLTAVQYYLADDVQIPTPLHKTVQLKVKDAQTVYLNSDYKEYINMQYVSDRIASGISACLYEGDKLVSWAITQDDGAIGFLHTLEDHRRKGYARSITLSMIEKLRSAGELPFAYAVPSNSRSIDLLLELGFKKNKTIHWFELK
jgi:ribosomal protein S18 acetylase RimI-like enzyme